MTQEFALLVRYHVLCGCSHQAVLSLRDSDFISAIPHPALPRWARIVVALGDRRPRQAEKRLYRSTSPSTMSIEPMAATTSAIRRPSHIFASVCKFANDGERICTRYGLAVPSLTT